jgi:tetratricopeptide (TPR) repeat protein
MRVQCSFAADYGRSRGSHVSQRESHARSAVRPVLTAVVALGVAAVSLGCASARIRKDNERALAIADARVLEGCYGCLQDARATYERLAVGKKGAGIVPRLFETNLVIALREKELALDSRATLERARALVPRVPAAVEAARMIAAVDAVLPDPNGLPMKTLGALRRSHAEYLETIDDELTWIEQAPLTPAVRKYVALSLDCSYADRKRAPGDTAGRLAKRREVPINAPRLVAYRAAYCPKNDTLALKRVLVAAPEFDETAYALAQTVVWNAGETGGDDASALLTRTHARFPRAPGVTFIAGWLASNLGDCEEAVRYLDATLAIEPVHDRALLQKVICLTNLKRDTAALAAATQFIALDTPNIAEGYYWRSVVRLRRRELELARSDIESAKARSKGGDVLSLAGMIEYEQADYSIAETDLRAARATWQGWKLCGASFYLGSTLTKREAWLDAAASFDSAMVCYDERAAETATKIEQVRGNTRGSAAFRARRLATLETDLADRRRRSRTAAFNVASMNARMGNLARAEEMLVIAAEEPELAESVGKLREQIAAASQSARPASLRQQPAPAAPRPKQR